MGVVYLAKHQTLQKQVAVKTISPGGDDVVGIERFMREAIICAKIEHPNVVPIYDVGCAAGIHYMIMQYVDGKTLHDLARESGPLSVQNVLTIAKEVLAGLSAVHLRGLIHRDLKPANIMLTNDSRVLLMDFGLARQVSESDLTQTNCIVGTPAFMSPEQLRDEPLDCRTDIYSLGVTLCFLMTGKLAIRREEIATQIDSECGSPGAAEQIAEVVLRAIADDRDKRFASADEMRTALDRIMKGD